MISPVNDYGSVEHYKENFADFLADVATGDRERDEQTIANILAGFELAICDWMGYYEDSLSRFRDLHGRFLRGEFAVEQQQKSVEENSY